MAILRFSDSGNDSLFRNEICALELESGQINDRESALPCFCNRTPSFPPSGKSSANLIIFLSNFDT